MRTKLYFFAGLYFLQGAALAYVVNFMKPYLAGHGVSKETIGLFSSLLLIPFVAKVGFGALSDRTGGRKRYMTGALAVFAACYAALARLDPGANFLAFAGVTWVGSVALALFDTCADGWAIDVASEDERGPVQAAMVAGKSLGLIMTSFVFGWLARDAGYGSIFSALAVLAASGLIGVALTPYRPRTRAAVAAPTGGPDLRRATCAWFALYGVTYSVASFGSDGLMTLHLMETRLASAALIGWFGVARGLGALCGAFAYVRLARRFGPSRARVVSVLTLACGCVTPLFGLAVGLSGWTWGFCWGLQETAFVTWAMSLSAGRWAATLFALAMICSNLGTALGEALAAPLVPRLGYAGVFLSFAALAGAALVPMIKSRASALR